MNERDDLAASIAGFIQQESDNANVFNTLACRLFAYQYERNFPYKRFCDGRGVTPKTLRSWQEIPPAPAAAFKHFALTCAPEEDCDPSRGGRIFHSSGTTGTETSRHFLDAAALQLYCTSLRAGYARFVPEWTAGIFALMPPPDEAPHSSLSFMLEELEGHFRWEKQSPLEQGALIWTAALAMWMRVQWKPYTIFGTAFAWVHFLDSTTEDFTLPEGCVIVETGGFKGRSREISRDELYALFTRRLGVPSTHCLAEYGMSEMASQFYDSTLLDHAEKRSRTPRKVGPYWLKTRVFDPVSGEEAAPGQPGLLAHYDLANLNSVMAIQTEDMGIAAPDGDGFTLLGRAPGAILRGCSLTAEDAMAAASLE